MSQAGSFGRDLHGKVAIVTGGSQGLGEAIAREFAERGARGLLLTGRNAARGEAVAESLRTAGCDARFHQVDLADLDAVRQVVPAAERAFGHLDILVNAADEAAETEAAKAASGKKLTHDDARAALGKYVNRFGMEAALEDGPKVLNLLFGESVSKVSAIPDDQESLAKAVAGIDEMTQKNPYKRQADL